MTQNLPSSDLSVDDVVEPAIALAREWQAAPATNATRRELASARLLSKLLRDSEGLEFTMEFVDRVARPQDDAVAAKELHRLATSGQVPSFIGLMDSALLKVGGRLAPLAPRIAMPLARSRLRHMVGHLVVDAADPALAKHIAKAKASGYRLNLNLLGEAVLGEDEADSRLRRTIKLVRRPDTDYVSIKISSLAAQLVTWDRRGSVARVLERIQPLMQAAKETGTFVNLDMEEYRDLDLTIDVFTQVLMMPEFLDVEAGIVIQAYLPDSLAAMKHLVEFSHARKRAGGAQIKIRLVKGANLTMEQAESELHGWPQAPYATKADVDANYVRILDWVLRPEHLDNLRIGVAGHNLFHLAMAHLLADGRGVSDRVVFEMLQGMAPAQAEAVRRATGGVLFYTPVVRTEDFDVAISYLVRRLEENAAPQNFLHQSHARVKDPLALAESRFRASVDRRNDPTLLPHRGQLLPVPVEGFYNQPDTDAAVQRNRDWAAESLASAPGALNFAPATRIDQVDAVVERAVNAQAQWGALSAERRAQVLSRAADTLNSRRGALVGAMAHEGGKTVAEADPEVSEAVDFGRYYAQSALDSLRIPGETFTPVRVTAVIPPWNFPVAIPTGGMFAGLAAGSAVIVKPAALVRRCGEIAATAIRDTLAAEGLNPDILQVLHVEDGSLGKRLVTHPSVGAVVLTGSTETASMFASWRPDLRLLAETSGKNALVVTPSADLDLAVADLVKSAFGHAGQKCSAASLAILVGSVYESNRFRHQLVDAVSSLRVGWGTDISTDMGPVIAPPDGKLLRGLTKLGAGERWLVKPRQLEASGRLWSPGIREGVRPGSWFHLTECFGPVLGLMHASDLDQAIELQNATDFGLTGGIHSLDQDEIATWLERVQVGNAYVNRHITGAIVRRQSFGGWKGSAVGPGAKAGGPNYVAEFGSWADSAPVTDPQAWLTAAKESDAEAWRNEFGLDHDESNLRVEANVFRYRPIERYTVRAGIDASDYEVERVLHAARKAGVPVEVSRASRVSDEAFAQMVASGDISGRIRAVGRTPGLREAAASRLGQVTVLDQPVVLSGRREMLCVLAEQALSITRHRFGHVSEQPTS